MTSKPLPERASLEQLKKQAKDLLRQSPDVPALYEAQRLVAREYGFASWNDLREHVEERALTFAAAADEFVRCATGGAAARALRLLAARPGLAHASWHHELVLGDAEAALRRLATMPDTAVMQPGGAQHWEPLLYVCHSFLHHDAPERAVGLVAIARELLRRGANPNAEYHWQWHPELPRTALWGALIAMKHVPLAELLLESGANPTDGVSTHIAAGGGHLEALELLHRYGMDANGVAGGVPPLPYLLGWASPAEGARGARWLLEHGADANRTWGEAGEAALHVAARRWDAALAELLVAHGADVHLRRADGRTAHTLAELHGNRTVADWLLRHGAHEELTPLDRLVSACAAGDHERAAQLLKAAPALGAGLRDEHHRMLHVPAERGDTRALQAMLACGFDPNVGDADGVTPLHRAAMAGQAEAVSVLLAGGAKLDALDAAFAATPLVWACEGWSHAKPAPGIDHVEVARRLLAAGSPTHWDAPAAAPSPERTHEQLAEFVRLAAAVPE